jgi:hypothetical protein
MKTGLRLALGVGLLLSMASLALAQPCEVVDDGTGTVSLPPDGCGYLSPTDVHRIIAGLPAGTTIELAPAHDRFFNVGTSSGGPLGGEVETFDSFLELEIFGTGDLTGFNRFISLQVQCQVATGPRTPGDAVQGFDTEMVQLQGEIFGDPDFDVLRITVGGGLGTPPLPPSPGHTTLTRTGPPGSSFVVDSFFDLTYEIEYVGAPGGALAGLSGVSQGTLTMQTEGVQNANVPASQPWGLFFVAALLILATAFVLRRRMIGARS